jgi:uncharacterized linocin/CFP29 family protein
MNNLHRELAPVSDEAWTQIEEEAARTFKRHLAGRRVVDVEGPAGVGFSAVGTGRVRGIDSPGDGVQARLRQVAPLVELRAPFILSREEVDDVARGAQDADWQPVKDAAKQIAFAEDGAIVEGYPAASIEGIRKGASNPPVILPADAKDYPAAIAQALSQLRVAGVDGPYSVLLSADAYTEVSETSDHGYPVIEHIKRLLTGDIIWAPAISGAIVLTTRGGDFSLHLGQDLSIGYLSHTDTEVSLYLQESLTFLMLTSEAAVGCTPPA